MGNFGGLSSNDGHLHNINPVNLCLYGTCFHLEFSSVSFFNVLDFVLRYQVFTYLVIFIHRYF